MERKRRNRAAQKRALSACLVALAIITGCVALKESGFMKKLEIKDGPDLYRVRPGRYDHAAHVENEMLCTDCHPGAENADKAGMPVNKAGEPSDELCFECHLNEGVTTDLSLYYVKNKIIWTDVTRLSEDAVFSHRLHFEKGSLCEECHPGIKESLEVTFELRNDKDECIKCHAEAEVSGDCAVCHETIRENWEPPSHQEGWHKLHGPEARARIEPPYQNRCSLCHPDSTCANCHRDREPDDHTNYWRQRSHGISAGMDRDRCAVCHLSDSCESCHRETSPRSHTGSWAAPRHRHCISCHGAVQNNPSCYTCHKNAFSHLRATVMPEDLDHAASTSEGCRTCHLLIGTMRHLDNGERCRNCHQ